MGCESNGYSKVCTPFINKLVRSAHCYGVSGVGNHTSRNHSGLLPLRRVALKITPLVREYERSM